MSSVRDSRGATGRAAGPGSPASAAGIADRFKNTISNTGPAEGRTRTLTASSFAGPATDIFTHMGSGPAIVTSPSTPGRITPRRTWRVRDRAIGRALDALGYGLMFAFGYLAASGEWLTR